MKQWVGSLLAIILFIVLPMPMAQAKSYTIDDVQIRGWVQPNGDILMNEVFTYSFDGQFKELTRSFPKKHVTQVEQFESYIVNEKSPVVGAIKNESLLPMQVYLEDQTYVSVIGNDKTTVSVFYAYYMRNAVKSYSAYSDIDLTFFEDGYNHDVDFENVHISFVLPDDVGEDHIYGFMHDRHGTVKKYHSNGVVFETMKATAYTETSTRLLFPSTIMTEQTKEKVPAPLDAVIAQEEKICNPNSPN